MLIKIVAIRKPLNEDFIFYCKILLLDIYRKNLSVIKELCTIEISSCKKRGPKYSLT